MYYVILWSRDMAVWLACTFPSSVPCIHEGSVSVAWCICESLYLQSLTQCLAHSRRSVNIFPLVEWMGQFATKVWFGGHNGDHIKTVIKWTFTATFGSWLKKPWEEPRSWYLACMMLIVLLLSVLFSYFYFGLKM